MLTTTRAPDSPSAGRSSVTHAASPGPWRPTLLSMPAPTSCTRGAGLPGQGETESDLTTTAPRSANAPYSDSSVPCPDVPEAVSTGLEKVTLPTLVASMAARRPAGAALTGRRSPAPGGDPAAPAPGADAPAHRRCPPRPPGPPPAWSGRPPCAPPTPSGCAGRRPADRRRGACSRPAAPCPGQ